MWLAKSIVLVLVIGGLAAGAMKVTRGAEPGLGPAVDFSMKEAVAHVALAGDSGGDQ